uniref:Uncharacterized protein n=1 Tax=Anopheles atroparvus TaxID=41427 RepID=A0AAG5D3S8_ANOAO
MHFVADRQWKSFVAEQSRLECKANSFTELTCFRKYRTIPRIKRGFLLR